MNEVGVPSLNNIVRSSPTTANFDIFIGSSLNHGVVVEVAYYHNNRDNTFDKVLAITFNQVLLFIETYFHVM